MQTIETRYLGPTNSRGPRIKARATGGVSVTIPYPHDRSSSDKHAIAAIALARKLKWTGDLISGATRDGYVFVMADDERWTIGTGAIEYRS